MFDKKIFKIAISQLNPIPGNLESNGNKIKEAIRMAKESNAEILLLSPLPLSGINIKDFAFNDDFMVKLQNKIQEISSVANIPTILTIPNGNEYKEICIFAGQIQNIPKMPIDIHYSIQPFGKEAIITANGIHLKALGGFEEKIYTGGTTIINPDNKRTYQMKFFTEDFAILDFENRIDGCFCLSTSEFKDYSTEEFTWNCLGLGLHDYTKKAGFDKVVIGLSGGMDSAFVAALAVDFLGSENVYGFAMPSRHSSDLSEKLAKLQSENLGITFDIISIEDTFTTLEKTLIPVFKDKEKDVTEENMQSRIRGIILMSLSNKFNWMLLNTGNKSEAAVGYYTLYGDSCGSFAPISDVYKTNIYRLAKWRNANKPDTVMGKPTNVIPEEVINRPPTAELNDNQKDSDNLPEYPVLDSILFELIENGKSPSQLYSEFKQELVDKVFRLLVRNQFKRKQTVIGSNISSKPLSEVNIPSSGRFV